MENTASVWEDPQCPFRVEWAPEQLNRMRIAVVDAFYALPRGGIEIGGVLLGRVDGKVMQIESYAPIECEHLTGPSFVLSQKDEAALGAQVAALEGQVLGWFHSHTRSEIHFSPLDASIHDRYFPKASQIAMVLRPANSQPPMANYFFRGPKAEMVCGRNVFVVEPIKGKPAPAVRNVPIPVPLEPAKLVKAATTAEPAKPVQIADALPETAPVLPAFLQKPEPAASQSFIWLTAGLLILVLLGVAFFTRDLWMSK